MQVWVDKGGVSDLASIYRRGGREAAAVPESEDPKYGKTPTEAVLS